MPAIIEGIGSGNLMEVGLADAQAGHIQIKPVPFLRTQNVNQLQELFTVNGHYRTNHRCALVATQAANSRIFEFRNVSTPYIIPLRLTIKWLQTGAHTAAIEDSLDVFKCSAFTAADTTNTVTPSYSIKRTDTMNASSISALLGLKGVTVAGVAAGMTGGTLTKNGTPIGELAQWLLLTQPTTSTIATLTIDNFDDVNGTHPFGFAINEGFIIENRVLLGAAAASSVYIDFAWAEAQFN